MKITESELRRIIRKQIVNEVQGMTPSVAQTPIQKAISSLTKLATNKSLPEDVRNDINYIISDLGKIK